MENHKYKIVTHNGRYKIYIDDHVFLSFNQLDYKGFYSYKDDHLLYGIEFYLVGGVTIETNYKTKETWLKILKLLDTI